MTTPKPLKPAAIMAAHSGHHGCTAILADHVMMEWYDDDEFCETYRLAEALTAERAQRRTEQSVVLTMLCGIRTHTDGIRAALAGDTEGEQPQHDDPDWPSDVGIALRSDERAGDPR